MHQTKRQSDIMRAVRRHGSCAIAALADQFAVSEETIRRDVKPLVSEGLVIKVHGGIVVPDRLSEPPLQRRMQEQMDEKQRIAKAVAKRISDGDSLMMDTGSTTCYVAQALTEHSKLHVVTNSVEIARTLATRNGNRVYMAGGELRGDDGAAFGTDAIGFVGQFEVRYAVLSIGAIDAAKGLMDFHLCEGEFSKAVIGQAEHVIVAADHSKFGRNGLIKVCDPETVDILVTSAVPPDEIRRQFEAGDAEIEIV